MERKRTATRRSGRALDPALLAPKAHGRAEPVVGLLPQPAHWLTGGGEMGDLIRAKDWSATPLGPLHAWPESLRTTVRIVLAQRFPMLLWWGPQYIQIYNDAYIPIPGAKHPQRALGVPVSECWSEIWHILRPLIDTPFKGGPSTWIEDIRLDIDRHGFTEETHFTIAYSPVPDDSAPGGIGGVLATVHEITEKVIGERRIALLRDLGAGSADARTAEDACDDRVRRARSRRTRSTCPSR
ncbi:MAG TPA: hypothetical protein VI319_01870 [Burkholderiales bacterium]